AGDGLTTAATHDARAAGLIAACLDGLRAQARTVAHARHRHERDAGARLACPCDAPRSRGSSASAPLADITTPWPGVVAAVAVTVGQTVAAGDVLMVIEAMKMEHTITAPYAGTVESIHFVRGDRVPEGSALLELRPQE